MQRAGEAGSDSADQDQDEHDDQNQPEPTARIISPTGAVRPSRQSAEEQEDDDDQKYQAH